MMATTLPPVGHDPLSRHFDHKPYVFDGLREPYSTTDDGSTTTLTSTLSVNPRQTSTSSVIPVASVPLQPRNNENRSASNILLTPTGKGSMSVSQQSNHAHHYLGRSKKLLKSQILTLSRKLEFSATCLSRTSHFRDRNKRSREDGKGVQSRTSECQQGNVDDQLSFLASRFVSDTTTAETVDEGTFESVYEVDRDDGIFRHWLNALRRRRNVQQRTPVPHSLQRQNVTIPGPNGPFTSFSSPRFLGRHRRMSSSSSSFVETLKTASFSNPSMSMGSRSHRQTGSTEARDNGSGNIRYSIDSDQPISRPSLDEGALCRGLRRGQILRELLMSEESYLVDVRALNNLFSTLLTSAASISTPAKANIQRTLLEMLRLHTDLSNELHRVSRAEISTHRLTERLVRMSGTRSDIKRSSLESCRSIERDPKDRHSRHSIDSVDSNSRLCMAEPSEAADFAKAFRQFMPLFFVYEEFCSNHEVILHEIAAFQRSTSSWPLYETGIEALTRSIRAVNLRKGSDKRALTISDLLMSPIQRLTKYPLLFADLRKSTPVIDCPDSHAEIDSTLQRLQELVREVNHATDNHIVRGKVRKRWILQDRLSFNGQTLQASQFRMLGYPLLCGVLHLAYETRTQVIGAYGLCVLFETHVILTVPARQVEKFDVIAVIHLSNLKIASTSDGKGSESRMIFEFPETDNLQVYNATPRCFRGRWSLNQISSCSKSSSAHAQKRKKSSGRHLWQSQRSY